MHRPSCIRLRGCYFDEALCQKLPVSIPQLIAFFGDYPSNIGCDLWQIGFPSVFVHLCHETAHWNSSCPYNNMNASHAKYLTAGSWAEFLDAALHRYRKQTASGHAPSAGPHPHQQPHDLDSNVAVVREAVNEEAREIGN